MPGITETGEAGCLPGWIWAAEVPGQADSDTCWLGVGGLAAVSSQIQNDPLFTPHWRSLIRGLSWECVKGCLRQYWAGEPHDRQLDVQDKRPPLQDMPPSQWPLWANLGGEAGSSGPSLVALTPARGSECHVAVITVWWVLALPRSGLRQAWVGGPKWT